MLLSKDGALQLLLIIDHIFDWARDVYRPAIFHHLKYLSSNDASDTISIANDSDIFSLNNPVRTSRWKPFMFGSKFGPNAMFRQRKPLSASQTCLVP